MLPVLSQSVIYYCYIPINDTPFELYIFSGSNSDGSITQYGIFELVLESLRKNIPKLQIWGTLGSFSFLY